jgi:hypothetical protein
MVQLYSKLPLAWSRGVVGLTCGPVKAEIAGSSPVGTAQETLINKPGGNLFSPGFIFKTSPASSNFI